LLRLQQMEQRRKDYQQRKQQMRNNLIKMGVIKDEDEDENEDSFRMDRYQDKTSDFIKEVKAIHGDKWDYSNVIYITRKIRVILSCPFHGEFMQLPYQMIAYGRGCKHCARAKMGDNSRKTTEHFITRAKAAHGETYDYSKSVYEGVHTKIVVICRTHGEFVIDAHNHVHGRGCVRCNRSETYSKNGMEWIRYLSVSKRIQHGENGGEFVIFPTRFRADGYESATKTVYEFHGDLYHGNPRVYSPDYVNMVNGKTMAELYSRTVARKEEILRHGYKYVEIWEYDWNRAIKAVRWIQRKWRGERVTPLKAPPRRIQAPQPAKTYPPTLCEQEADPEIREQILALVKSYEKTYPLYVSQSKCPHPPNFNPRIFTDALYDLWKDLGKTVTIPDIARGLTQLNENYRTKIYTNPRSRLGESVVKKCEAKGLWLFVQRKIPLDYMREALAETP